jgi:hypothetical protein
MEGWWEEGGRKIIERWRKYERSSEKKEKEEKWNKDGEKM